MGIGDGGGGGESSHNGGNLWGEETGRTCKTRHGGLGTLESIRACAESNVSREIEMFIPREGSAILFAQYLLFMYL